MPSSIIEAIKLGYWNFDPDQIPRRPAEATEALPGSPEKLEVLAERLAKGQPLWHPADRLYRSVSD
jgi:hypothetical protein